MNKSGLSLIYSLVKRLTIAESTKWTQSRLLLGISLWWPESISISVAGKYERLPGFCVICHPLMTSYANSSSSAGLSPECLGLGLVLLLLVPAWFEWDQDVGYLCHSEISVFPRERIWSQFLEGALLSHDMGLDIWYLKFLPWYMIF